MNTSTKRTSLLAVVSSLAALAASSCQSEHHAAEERPELVITNPIRKDVEIAREYVCQIHAFQHIELRALERGYLQGIFVDEGDEVKKGQRMFQIMPKLYQAEYDKAKAEAEFAEIEFKNTKLLADKDVVSPNELALARAKLDKAKAELALTKVHRGFTDIRAPFDGLMDRLHVRQGSLLEEGELLTTLSDISKMWVYFNVTEAEYLNYKTRPADAGPETVKLIMANNQVFGHAGVIETIEAEFNHETGTIAFRATFPNPEKLLRHGETGKVVMTTSLHDAMLVPQKATFEVLDKKYVFVVDDDGVVHSRRIVVGEELPHLYVVQSGLEESDTILIEGLRRVEDGDRITPSPEKPSKVYSELELSAE